MGHRLGRIAVLLAAAIILAGAAGAATPQQPDLTDLSGKPLLLDDYRGRLVLLNFWATWCAPCLREMPELDRASREIDSERAVVLGIAADDPEEVGKFIARQQIGYRVASGDPDTIFAWTEALGNLALGLPYSVLLDADGEIIWHKTGGTVTAEEVVGLIQQYGPDSSPDR